MYRVQVHSKINLIISWLYKFGLWHQGDDAEASGKDKLVKWFYSVIFFCFLISVIAGAVVSESFGESIFLGGVAIMGAVFFMKLCFMIWKSAEIVQLLNEISVYTTPDHEGFLTINKKMEKLINFISAFVLMICCAGLYCFIVLPLFTKTLFFNIALPFDYKTSETAFWFAYSLCAIQLIPIIVGLLFNALSWYLLLSCGLRYELLGRQVVSMGHTDNKNLSIFEKNNLYDEDLTAVTVTHAKIKESVNNLESFLSLLLIAVFSMSAISICTSLYSVIFITGAIVEKLIFAVMMLYNIFDIFMLTYFGNEIKVNSDRFTYCLFESDWIDKSQLTKKSITIFSELLMHPHEIFVLKLIPLSLETFSRILNSAYSMLNILKNLK